MLDLTPQLAAVFGARPNVFAPTAFCSITWVLVMRSGCSRLIKVRAFILMTGNGSTMLLIVLSLLALLSRRRRESARATEVIDGFWVVITHCATTKDRSPAGMLLALT